MQQLQKEVCECQNEMSSSPSSAGSAPSGTFTLHTTALASTYFNLCGGSIADLVVKAAGAAAVAHHRVGAVGHIAHLAKARQLGTDGLGDDFAQVP